MKAVFYGGGDHLDNMDLHRELLRLGGTRAPRITYIPSSSDYGMQDFPDFVHAIRRVSKAATFVYMPIDHAPSARLLTEGLRSEIIFLSGGNTYQFLRDLRRSKLLAPLRQCANGGTVMSGLSAGGILLTPNIRTASFPSWDRDDNFVNLKRSEALALTKFEFFPHYSHSPRYRAELTAYSKKCKNLLIGVRDGGGIVVNEDKVALMGVCTQFDKGHALRVRL